MKNKWNHYGVAAMFTLAVGASLVLAGCGGSGSGGRSGNEPEL